MQELGILRNIKYLLLDGNTLDKNFLQSSGVMPSLKVLSVSNCGLNGTLPIPGNLKQPTAIRMNDIFSIEVLSLTRNIPRTLL